MEYYSETIPKWADPSRNLHQKDPQHIANPHIWLQGMGTHTHNKQTKQARSIKCQYLGFTLNQKAHILVDVEVVTVEQSSRKILTSQDVVFNKGGESRQQIIIEDFEKPKWNAKQVGDKKESKTHTREVKISVSKTDEKIQRDRPMVKIDLESKASTTLPHQLRAQSPETCKPTPEPPAQPCCLTQRICLPEWYGARTNKHTKYAYMSVINKPPKTFKEAMERLDFHLWLAAMIDKIDLITKHRVWKQANCPTDKNVVECQWVLTYKRGPNGKIVQYKA
ncbi:Retrovirus-related Pol polyprotein from transposon TNT 1-94 [Rhizoctonia solani]|uniref:Retrovirus-related Pol polyprotein from transposon TNT 1-94 n=1 Tax=Rhizoctonia solani TaxID=456999 RepID=A0A8H8P127_9AGAM|nr:Retrovirus-related Pol polyprotein from transposon TNT 1-94 [Rhizoctonia solani]QRW23105.1 Retrovirus-related Pol polyprotein from transposon TNT 1-94 [Rhizoctonia solani]